MLKKIHDAVWLLEGEIVGFLGFPCPTRSVIVRLPSGNLWTWSPIGLVPDLRTGACSAGEDARLPMRASDHRAR
jgi:hypothetical protein